jgi:uncharacterized protein
MTLQFITQTLDVNKQRLSDFDLTRTEIFRSIACNEKSATNDINRMLDFDSTPKTYKNFFACTTFLETLSNRLIDAVTPQALNPYKTTY